MTGEDCNDGRETARKAGDMDNAKAKALYLLKLRDRLVARCGNNPLVAIALESADLTWDESAKVNYDQGIVDGQENLAKALHVMQGRVER